MNKYKLFEIVNKAVTQNGSTGIIEFDGEYGVKLVGGLVYGIARVAEKLYAEHRIDAYFRHGVVRFHK